MSAPLRMQRVAGITNYQDRPLGCIDLPRPRVAEARPHVVTEAEHPADVQAGECLPPWPVMRRVGERAVATIEPFIARIEAPQAPEGNGEFEQRIREPLRAAGEVGRDDLDGRFERSHPIIASRTLS